MKEDDLEDDEEFIVEKQESNSMSAFSGTKSEKVLFGKPVEKPSP